MVSSDLSSAEKEYTAVIAHLTGTPTVADCFYKESDNGYRVITKLDKGSLAIDTSFDPTPCAKAITDFTDNDILVSLQNNASQGVVWVEGIEHPTFSWDLTNRLADYTAVNVALDKVPQDISVYTDETVSVLKQAIDSVDTSLSAAEQSKVDAMAQAIEDAITVLQYKDADYTKVDAAIAKANALNKDNYKDFTGVEAAVNAVTRGKNITEQTEVDAMAKAIEDAIAALQYKDADYTKVDAAIAKANALNKNDYKDFSGVETAVKAVVRGKNITEQSEVDKMAKAIEDAIAALEKKPASTKPGTSDKSPQTGDSSNIVLWISLLFASGGAAIGTMVVSRKKKYNVSSKIQREIFSYSGVGILHELTPEEMEEAFQHHLTERNTEKTA